MKNIVASIPVYHTPIAQNTVLAYTPCKILGSRINVCQYKSFISCHYIFFYRKYKRHALKILVTLLSSLRLEANSS